MEPSSFKFDEEDCRGGGNEMTDQGEQLDNFSYYENDTFDDDDDHYFRMPPSTTAAGDTVNDVNSNTAQGRGTSSAYDNVIGNDTTSESIKKSYDAPTSSSAHTTNTSVSSQLPPRSSNNSMNAPPPPPPPPPTQPPPRRPTRTNNINRSANRNTQHKQKRTQSTRQQKGSDGKTRQNDQTNNSNNNKPTLEPYIARLEKFELFSTLQCYYLVACDKHRKVPRLCLFFTACE